MFFILSKLLWVLVQPTTLILLCLLLGVLLLRRRRERAGRRLVAIAALGYLVGGFSPFAHLITVPLENRFSRPDLAAIGDSIAGIIVLGGGQDTLVARSRKVVALTDAAERLTDPVALLRALPDRPLIFSGGGGQLLYDSMSEAEVAKAFYDGLGIDPARIWLERDSLNTYQNAVLTRELLRQRGLDGKRFLLVTSAYHMPRSVGCFRAAGIDVVAWPVDYRTRGWNDAWRLFSQPSDGLKRLDEMTREWVGLVVYRLAGRTSELLPADDR
jgi:uncharacterized SAM-binding protein YcdF (DUF218 family)